MMQSWWSGTPAPTGEVTMATAVVPDADTGNAGVDGPTTNPAGTQFDLTFHWDLDGAESGDRYFGFIDLGTDPANAGNIGTTPVTLDRHEDDVTKTASQDQAVAGNTVSYDITIQPNVTPNDLTYTITDTVPEGFTIDEASVTGDGVVDGQTITWEIEVPTPVGLEGNYSYTTNLTDASCVPYFGGYLDLRTVIDAQPTPGVVGDVGVFNYLTSTPFNFFCEHQLGLGVTPHGFVLQGGTYGGTPWVAQSLPNPAAPNGLIAPFWADTEIVRVEGDPGAERGVTVASDPTAAIVEFDNLQMFGEPTQVLGDVQLQVLVETDPNGPDAWIVFGEPGFIPSDFSIGIEDLEGDRGLSIGDSIEDLWQAGNVICLDYEG